MEQVHQREDEESEQGDHWTKGDKEKTEDVFRDTLLPSVCFQFVSEDFAFVVEHIAFME